MDMEHPVSQQDAQPGRSPLLLPSLHIEGFRAFRNLTIPRLGRVNLVVGRNNVGKTTLLEALRVYASGQGAPWVILEILEQRRESPRMAAVHAAGLRFDIRRLFFDDGAGTSLAQLILAIEPAPQAQSRLAIWLEQVYATPDPQGQLTLRDPQKEDFSDKTEREMLFPVLHVENEEGSYPIPIRGLQETYRDVLPGEGRTRCQYVPAQPLTSDEIGKLWDGIVLTDLEDEVTQALRIVAPEIERISLTEDSSRATKERSAVVRRRNRRAPESLKSLGDGMNRIFEIALGLVNARGGFLLVDEIENGIHYSVQEELWRFVLEGAARLGVQVFATTHSWDCIEAFQEAAGTHPDEGMLVCLARKGDGDIHAAVFDERDLAIATRESIEVR